MGNIFSFFKKPKGTKEQLEDLENELDKIEEYKISASVRERNLNALLIFSSVIIYFIGIGYLYFDYNSNKSYIYKAVALCFLALVPTIVYYTKNLVGMYYKWVKETNDMKRTALLKLKKKILSKVQETETFNDAKMILERFDPSALRNMSMSLTNLSQLDRDASFSYRPSSRPTSLAATQNSSRILSPPHRPTQPPAMNPIGATPSNTLVSFSAPPPPPNYTATPRMGSNRTVKPILPQNRSIVEKVVDYIFADGPSNRFALICARCSSHNGMALPDEFEYISYICAYCGHFNPARKMRPSAPKMEMDLSKAIEGPKVEEAADDDQNSTVKITELSTVLNKSLADNVHVTSADEATDEHDKTTTTTATNPSPLKSGSSAGPSISSTEPIPYADDDVPEGKNERQS